MICAKGFETATGLRLSEVVAGERPGRRIAALSGPNFAREVAQGLPAATTLGCADPELGESIAAALSGPSFRVYWTDDVIGVEVGGAVKNVLAIAAGIVAGRGLGENARAALITRGLAELARLGEAEGGRRETLMGLSGLGDLVLTAGSLTSRNMAFGHAIGRGVDPAALRQRPGALVEGAHTAAAVTRRARELERRAADLRRGRRDPRRPDRHRGGARQPDEPPAQARGRAVGRDLAGPWRRAQARARMALAQAGGVGDAAEGEDVDTLDPERGVPGAGGGKLLEKLVGRIADQKVADRIDLAAERADRVADAAVQSVFPKRAAVGRPGDPDPERRDDLRGAQLRRTLDDRCRAEAELADQPGLEAGAPQIVELCRERLVQRLGADPPVRLGIAGEADAAKAMLLQQVAAQQLEARRIGPDRRIEIAADHQRARHPGLAREAREEVAELGEARDPARGDVRHRDQARRAQPARGLDHVVVGVDAARR